MSRVGSKPIKIASGVKLNWNAPNLEVSGKGGTLKRVIPPTINIEIKGEEAMVINTSDDPKKKELHGLTRTLVHNMVVGVSEGYSKQLELQGVGYRAQAQGQKLNLSLGFSHPVVYDLPEGVKAKVDANTKITLSGPDKEIIGQTAANIRKIRPPEPYKGKGVRYAGEVISLKQGKTAGK